MATDTMESPTRGFFSVRLNPTIFLLILGYLCIQAGYEDTFVGRMVNFRIATWMFFLFSWLLPLAAIPIAIYQLVRYRSLQHLLEIGVAVWLLVEALQGVVKSTG